MPQRSLGHPAPQSGYAAAALHPGHAPGRQEPFFQQSGYPVNMHPGQQPGQMSEQGVPRLQPGHGAPQQSGYGAPHQGGWAQAHAGHHGPQPGAGVGGYPQHQFPAPTPQPGPGSALARPPTLQPPQQRPYHGGTSMQAPPFQQQQPPQWRPHGPDTGMAGPPAPDMDTYGEETRLTS
jgi:hypothetical protein